MSNLNVTLDFPEYIDPALLWAQKVYESMQAAHKFLDLMYWFGNRDAFDLRQPEDKFKTTHPCYHMLTYGTQEEVDKGFLSSSTSVRKYSLCGIRQQSMFYIPIKHLSYHSMSVEESPYLPAWMVINKRIHVGSCSHIFVTNFSNGTETPSFFFPFSWGGQKDLYILMTFGRYVSDVFLYQGDPNEWAKEYKRYPRNVELEGVDNFEDWVPPTIPNELTIDIVRWEDESPVYSNPREFEIPEFREALIRLETSGPKDNPYYSRR